MTNPSQTNPDNTTPLTPDPNPVFTIPRRCVAKHALPRPSTAHPRPCACSAATPPVHVRLGWLGEQALRVHGRRSMRSDARFFFCSLLFLSQFFIIISIWLSFVGTKLSVSMPHNSRFVKVFFRGFGGIMVGDSLPCSRIGLLSRHSCE